MIFTDSHAHLYDRQFDDDRDEMIQRAIGAGIERIFLPNIEMDTVQPMLDLVAKFPNNCFPMMGLHPSAVKEDFEEILDQMETITKNGEFVAVGEIGIDLYWDTTYLEQQKQAFKQQVRLAKEINLPIVIHARDSFDVLFECLDELNDDSLSGVFHCFTGTLEQARRIIDYGDFMIGLGGVLTFKNSGLSEVVKYIDLKHVLLETDSPYLAPVPYRGRRNESFYLWETAKTLAKIIDKSVEEIARVTTENSIKLFKK